MDMYKNINNFLIFSIFFAVLFATNVFAQDASYKAKVKAVVDEFKKDTAWRSASWGFSIVSAANGKTVAEHNSKQSLTPASSMKILTTGAAISILGSNHRFETFLEYQGTVNADGILDGNIIIRGGGNPCLGASRIPGYESFETLMHGWSEEVKKTGIKQIRGKIIADDTYFEDALIPSSWAWNDIGNYYGAAASGLSINENIYRIHLSSGANTGDDVKIVKTAPEIPGLTFVNELKTGRPGSGDSAYIFGVPFTYLRYLRGTIPPGRKDFIIKGSLPDPALFLAISLEKRLKEKGIEVTASVATKRDLLAKGEKFEGRINLMAKHGSPPLSDIIYHTNMQSINLYAEHLLKEIGKKIKNEGSTVAGIAAVTEFWRQRGLNTSEGLVMEDGSGLSHFDAVSAEQFTKALAIMHKENSFNDFYRSLPVAGISGSIAKICKGTEAEGNLCAKSGYMNRVRSYVGYVKNKKGELLAFAFIINNYTESPYAIKKKIEKLLVAIAG